MPKLLIKKSTSIHNNEIGVNMVCSSIAAATNLCWQYLLPKSAWIQNFGCPRKKCLDWLGTNTYILTAKNF